MILTPTNPFRRLGRWRYSLRSLLLAVTAIAVFLAWWTMPFDVEEYGAHGDVLGRFRVRRDWRGDNIAAGEQVWFWDNGRVYERQEVWGARREGYEFTGPGQFGPLERWDREGAPISVDADARLQPDFDSLIWLIVHTIVPESSGPYPEPIAAGISEFRHGGGTRIHDTKPDE